MKYSPLLVSLAVAQGTLLSRQASHESNGASQPSFVPQMAMNQPQLLARPQLPGEVPQLPGVASFADQLPALPNMPPIPSWSPQPGYSLPQVQDASLPSLGPGFERGFGAPASVPDAGQIAGVAADAADGLPPLPPLPDLPALPPDMQNMGSFIQPIVAQQAPPASAQMPVVGNAQINGMAHASPPLLPPVAMRSEPPRNMLPAVPAAPANQHKHQQREQQPSPNVAQPQVQAQVQKQVQTAPRQRQPIPQAPQPMQGQQQLPAHKSQQSGQMTRPGGSTKARKFLAGQAKPATQEPRVATPMAMPAAAPPAKPLDDKMASAVTAQFLASGRQPSQPVAAVAAMPPFPNPNVPVRPELPASTIPALQSPQNFGPQDPRSLPAPLQMPGAFNPQLTMMTAPQSAPSVMVPPNTQPLPFIPGMSGANGAAFLPPAMPMQYLPQNMTSGGLPFLANSGASQGLASQEVPMFIPNAAMPMANSPLPTYPAPGAMMGAPGKLDPMAALQMPQMQNQMVSAIQSQYSAQLAQYQQQQQAFADWANKYQEYQRNLAAQQQQYKLQQQQYQAFLQGQQRAKAAPRPSLVQTGVRSQTAREAMLASRERALASRGKALAAREGVLRQKVEQVREEEWQEGKERANLDARAKALAEQEQRVQKFENQLIQEQRKIWKVLKHRQGTQAATVANAAPLAPRPAAPTTVRQTAPATIVRRRPRTGRKHGSLALAQVSSETAATASRRKAVSSVAIQRLQGGSGAARANTQAMGSDVEVVTAAQVLPDADDDEDAVAPSSANQVSTSTPSPATADNDDLEQILLQQSSSVRHVGDPVESS